MNMLLLTSNITDNACNVRDRQLRHLLDVHKAELGDSFKVGHINGLMGTGTIVKLDNEQATLMLDLTQDPPPPLPLTLLLALPRPKMLRRTLQTIAAMGVKKLYLINSSRVEKSFWQSPFLTPDAIEEQLVLGLEQARDTLFPEVHLRKLFKPFVEDELPSLIKGTTSLVAHPNSEKNCPVNTSDKTTLAIGPEGGFIPFEIDKLEEIGFKAVHLGPRILRVENAVPSIISRLFPG
jgi:RsmE family RNA methyltransferase